MWSDHQILILCDVFKKENLQWTFLKHHACFFSISNNWAIVLQIKSSAKCKDCWFWFWLDWSESMRSTNILLTSSSSTSSKFSWLFQICVQLNLIFKIFKTNRIIPWYYKSNVSNLIIKKDSRNIFELLRVYFYPCGLTKLSLTDKRQFQQHNISSYFQAEKGTCPHIT